MKTEFQTKEHLINSLTLEGRTELINNSTNLGVPLEQYVETMLYAPRTQTYWIDTDLINVSKLKKVYLSTEEYKKNKKNKDSKLF